MIKSKHSRWIREDIFLFHFTGKINDGIIGGCEGMFDWSAGKKEGTEKTEEQAKFAVLRAIEKYHND